MSLLKSALAAVLALLPSLAGAQQFPTVPAQSVIGRLGIPGDTGPSQAIPFKTLAVQLGLSANILNFGGKCTGNIADAAANATALTQALASGSAVYLPWCAAGYHFGTNQITVATGKAIFGEKYVKLKSTATTSLFRVTSFETTDGPAVIQNIQIDMTGSGASSTAIRLGTSTGVVYGAQLSQILCTSAVECIGDETSASNYVGDLKIYDVRSVLTRGRQFHISRSRGFIWIDTVRVDQTQTGQTLPVTWNGAEFADISGLEINRLDVVGPSTAQTTTYQSGSTGRVITGTGGGTTSVWLNRVLVDNGSGNGVNISGVTYLQANWLETFQNLGYGIFFTSVATSQLSNVLSVGAIGLTGAAAAANGFTCTTCTNLNVSNIILNSNTGSGMVLSGTTNNILIDNYQAASNTSFALTLPGTTVQSNILVHGGAWNSNGGLLSNSSAGGNVAIRNVDGYPNRTVVADAAYAAIPSDDVVAYTSISTARTVTLPAASLFAPGRILIIRDDSGSSSITDTISAAPNGSDTIDGSNTTQVMVRTAYGSAELESDGTSKWTFGPHAYLNGQNIWTASQSSVLSVNANFSGMSVNNQNTGTGALATFAAQNSAATSLFGMGGVNYTTIPILAGRLFMSASSASQGQAINTEGALPIVFGVNNAEAGRFNTKGFFGFSGTAPAAPGSCGTGSPATTSGSTNNAGQITTGSGASTSCILTFANSGWTAAPFCTATPEGAANSGLFVTTTTTTLTFTYTSATSLKLNYHCFGG